jgi:rare lipoprotein A
MRPCVLALLLLTAVLSSCATSTPRGGGRGTLRPYTVKGTTYRPLTRADGFREEGYASWYEPGWFSGRTTADGERLRAGELTCAHKILPMNTLVRVTNLENGREVTVRVNDRGPFVAGRCIDLTPAGATALGFYGKGSARVRLTTEGDIPGLAGGQLPGPFFVQVGAFAVQDNADRLLARMVQRGFAQTRLTEGDQDGQHLWRVQAGTFPSLDEALGAREHLLAEFPDAFVIAK